MTELDKLKRAKMYMEKLADGINPLYDSLVPDQELINNVRMSRCFFYVSDVLERLIENGGEIKKEKAKKIDFFIPPESLEKFDYSDFPIALSEFAKRLNILRPSEDMKKLGYSKIAGWLIHTGFLKTEISSDDKTVKRPTKEGNDIGIFTEQRTGMRGDYIIVLYNRSAQQFIIDNLDSIVEFNKEKG